MEIKSADYSDETLAKAFDLLFPDWVDLLSNKAKSYKMIEIIGSGKMPICSWANFSNCIGFLINNKGK